MSLSAGTRLGAYEIIGLLGAGGMGEVYRARDSRLNRDVALKVLPDAVADDAGRLARFKREAQVLAALNHPNIAAIYGFESGTVAEVGSSRPVEALVLELVEGPTLADRIALGPILQEEALPIARQIADALEAAHEQGIVHRDLKPANIKLRPDGTVKVLDFGLAKAIDPQGAGAVASRPDTMSPTITSPVMMTGAGVILGTAAYMAPEQAKGRAADKRSDIWAFGCVLYEMLTGKRVFEGEDVADTLVAILSKEPEWTTLPATTPDSIRRLLRRALERDRRRRLADVCDARLELDEATSSSAADTQALRPSTAGWRRWLPLGAVAAFAASVAGTAVWVMRPEAPRQVARFTVTLPPDQQFTATARHFVAISPDGSRIAYLANNRLYIRAIDHLAGTEIPGTEGPAALAARVPFFSPDGQWLGFWHDGQIKKVPLSGGAPISLAAAAIPEGASWSADDSIIYSQGTGLWRIAAAGGSPEQLLKVDAGLRVHGPQLLPGGRAVLFTIAQQETWNDVQVVAQSLADGTRRVVVAGGADARYLPTGHLVYAAKGSVLAVPFDVETLTTTRGPVPLVDEVAYSPSVCCAAHFSVSDAGALVYVPVSSLDVTFTQRLVWVDRTGRETAIPVPPRRYLAPSLSPDGTRVAFHDTITGDDDVWTYEFRRGIFERLTSDRGRNGDPVWSPDGRRIAYHAGIGEGGPGIFVRSADGTGDVQRLTTGTHIPFAWSPDGTRLVFADLGTDPITPIAPTDIGVVTIGPEPRVEKLVAAPGRQDLAQFSPDGRWLAYTSNETGEMAVFVRPFPDVSAARWRISSGPGAKPLWAADGRTLFYASGQAIMAVAVQGSTPADWGTPERLFEGPYVLTSPGQSFDVAPDGRFLMVKEDGDAATRAPDTMIIVQNWFEELRQRVPN